MTPTEWGIVIAAIAAVPRGVTALEALGKSWLATRRSDRPQSSTSGDKMKAIATELATDRTVNKVNELHEALAQRNSVTRAYLIPEQLHKQTEHLQNIAEQSESIEQQAKEQTRLLKQISGSRPFGKY